MPYTIVITKTDTEVVLKSSQWKKIGQIEKKRKQTMYDGSNPEEADVYLSDEYGYTPELITKDTVTKEIFKQTVDELDVGGVVAIVNKIGK